MGNIGSLTKGAFIKISRGIAWAPISVLIGHSIFAKFFGHEPYVDPVMHFSGGVAAAYFFRELSVIGAEVFVVGAVARLVQVEQSHDQAGLVEIAANAARGLDILGGSLRLALNNHETQARDVEAD